MLYNDNEIAIMAEAIQVNMRNPAIAVKPYETIIGEQLPDISFAGARILDIGPGQCDLLDIAKAGGAASTAGIDFDPAICKLGQARGHAMTHANLTRGWPLEGETFDGIFCRGSINVFWFKTPEAATAFLDDMMACLAPNGWLWIAPWNRPAATAQPEAEEKMQQALAHWRERHAIEAIEPDDLQKKQYGIGYGVPRVEIWRKLPAAKTQQRFAQKLRAKLLKIWPGGKGAP